jgi:biopolymer transport protein ExbB
MIEVIYSILRGLASIIGQEQGLVDMWESIRTFIEMGGDVLLLIGLLMIVMWVLIIERIIYFMTSHHTLVRNAIDSWNARRERKSWHAHRIRELMISEVKLSSTRYLGMIQACVALAPLMGLLGTVTGMIEVFEVMAIMGSGNARAMAAGVSKATVPTMCGMVAALSGLFLSVWLKRKGESEVQILSEHMTMDH